MSQSADQENGVLGFLNGTAADIHGRTFDDVLAFSDEQIERTHNFIQWLFPLPNQVFLSRDPRAYLMLILLPLGIAAQRLQI